MVSGSVGHDGSEYLDRLKEKGVNISLVKQHDHDVTPTAIVGTDSDERQITFFHPGADRETKGPDIASVKDDVAYVLISPHSATSMMETAQYCQHHSVPYIFDPGQNILIFSPDDLRRMVQGSNSLIVNSYEWKLLSDALNWSVDEVLQYTGFLVVTHGEHGLGIQTREESIVIEAVPAAKLVNPTGAGDALRAGLVTGLAYGWEPRDAGRLGAALASFVVEEEGTQLEKFKIGRAHV